MPNTDILQMRIIRREKNHKENTERAETITFEYFARHWAAIKTYRSLIKDPEQKKTPTGSEIPFKLTC